MRATVSKSAKDIIRYLEVVELIEKNRKGSSDEVLNDIEAAREKGDIRKDINPEFNLFFGAITNRKALFFSLLRALPHDFNGSIYEIR